MSAVNNICQAISAYVLCVEAIKGRTLRHLLSRYSAISAASSADARNSTHSSLWNWAALSLGVAPWDKRGREREGQCGESEGVGERWERMGERKALEPANVVYVHTHLVVCSTADFTCSVFVVD